MNISQWLGRLFQRPGPATRPTGSPGVEEEPSEFDLELVRMVDENLRRRPIESVRVDVDLWQRVDPTRLPMPGWDLVAHEPEAARWRDASGDVISLTLFPADSSLPALSDQRALQHYCRTMAEGQLAGLVEVTSTMGAEGPSVVYVYKKLVIPAFKFFGVIATPIPTGVWVWMVFAQERGTTGVREAVVTTRLAEAGLLTLESYEATWAQDPYDSSYDGVPRSTLRYQSDAEQYDAASRIIRSRRSGASCGGCSPCR